MKTVERVSTAASGQPASSPMARSGAAAAVVRCPSPQTRKSQPSRLSGRDHAISAPEPRKPAPITTLVRV